MPGKISLNATFLDIFALAVQFDDPVQFYTLVILSKNVDMKTTVFACQWLRNVTTFTKLFEMKFFNHFEKEKIMKLNIAVVWMPIDIGIKI